jgi:hypothetical protein
MLIVAQPVAMLCHAIGGVLLALLVGGAALGREIDRLPAGSWRPSRWRPLARELDWKAIAKRLFVTCWPLLTTVLVVVLWKTFSPEPVASMNRWRWDQKAWSFVLTLRDQSLVLDAATTIACFGLILCGWLAGARWSWRQGLPGLLVLLLFVAIPSDINGSAFVDVRLLPVAAMLLLAFRTGAGRSLPMPAPWPISAWRCWACAGGHRGQLRDYAQDYRASLPRCTRRARQPRAGFRRTFLPRGKLAQHAPRSPGQPCQPLSPGLGERQLGSAGAAHGGAALPPRPQFTADPPNSCGRPIARAAAAQRRFRAQVRADRAGGLCLADRHRPAAPPDPRLQLVWQDGRSLLFAVRPLGFPNWKPRDF